MRHTCMKLLVLACLGAGGGMSAAPAAADLDRIRERGVLRVGIKNDRPGSGDAHKDPAHVAKRDFEIALARALADHLFGSPDKVEFSTRRKRERLRAVARGEVDLGIAMHRIGETDEAVVYSTPYYETGLACLQRADAGITRMEDLAGKTVALVARNSDALPSWLAEATAGLSPAPTLTAVTDFRAAAEAIAAGRVDALLSERVNIDAFLARHPQDLVASPRLTAERVGIVMAKGDHALLQLVNAVLAELERTDALAGMRETAGLD